MNWGDETAVFFEIDHPFCIKNYGTTTSAGVCAAVLGTTGANKCYNGMATCQDTANYNPGVLTLRFSYANGAGRAMYGNVIPSLMSISTSASAINLAGMDVSLSPLGKRETVTVKLSDHLYSDLVTDKYRLERITGVASSPSVPFDPDKQGTFWGKWLARNPYHASFPSYQARIRRGFIGQALSDMTVRNYAIDRVDVDKDGSVTFNLKDLFSKLDDAQAVAPRGSKGDLAAPIASGAGSLTLSPVGIGDLNYPAAGYVRIGDEILSFTRAADVMTVGRGQFNTLPAAHSLEDAVQLVLAYTGQQVHNIIYDLITGYSPITAASIPKTRWDAVITAAGFSNLYTAYITEPTPVKKLVGELMEQCGVTLYADVVTGLIELVPLVPTAPEFTMNDAGWIIKDSISTKKLDTKRVSQVWTYYSQVDPTKSIDTVTNFRSRYIAVDGNAEATTQYGAPKIREIFSRWIPQFARASATDTAERILFMFRDPPIETKLSVHKSRLPSLSLAGLFTLLTTFIQGATGLAAPSTNALTSIEVQDNRINVTAQQTFFSTFSTAAGIRRVFIDANSTNLNMRTLHDALYTTPTGAEHVQIIINPGIQVGTASTGLYALRTGSWPVGTTLDLLIGAGAGIWGAGGNAGVGGDSYLDSRLAETVYFANNGANGTNGGPALLVERVLNLTNNGSINGGGGGGSGGGGSVSLQGPDGNVAGSGGGGGQGWTSAGLGASGGFYGLDGSAIAPGAGTDGGVNGNQNGLAGSDGSISGPGAGGAAVSAPSPERARGGFGGAGGTSGQPGQTGDIGRGDSPVAIGVGGTPGSAGVAVQGSSLVTYTVAGTINGPLAG